MRLFYDVLVSKLLEDEDKEYYLTTALAIWEEDCLNENKDPLPMMRQFANDLTREQILGIIKEKAELFMPRPRWNCVTDIEDE